MHNDCPIQPLTWPQARAAGSETTPRATWTRSTAGRQGRDRLFEPMMQAYRAGGGLARDDDVVALVKQGSSAGVVQLARWIVERRVIMFEWQAQSWLPCFQFHWPEIRLRDELAPVFAELAPVYEPWELARWFVEPNGALGERLPVEALRSDADAVLQAARTDGFVARG